MTQTLRHSPALFPSVPDSGPGRWEAWSDLCDEVFRFGMRPEVAAVAQDALRICLAADQATRWWQEAVESGANGFEIEQLAVAAQIAYERVEAVRMSMLAG